MSRWSVLKFPVLCLIFTTILNASGCSIARYQTGDISKNPEAVKMEFLSIKDYERVFTDVKTERIPGKNAVKIALGGLKHEIGSIELGANKTFSVKYHYSLIHQAPNVYIDVEFPNGRKYTAYLDTGCPGYSILTSDIVLDNKLPVLPNGPLIKTSTSGICHIPELTIGPALIKDGLAFYEEQQWQFRIMNIPIYKHPNVIIGLQLIRSFDYVLFDNLNKEAEFSKGKTFTLDAPDLWLSYPFEIKPGPYSNERIMVQLPINGKNCEIFFDTCGDKPGLSLNQTDWEDISKNFTVKNLRKSHYYNFMGGRLPCQKAIVSKLSIGGKTYKNAEVLIKDEKDMTGKLSMFSLGYFQNTTVVLDFVNNLMWIKK